jgi:predicted DNA binding protein
MTGTEVADLLMVLGTEEARERAWAEVRERTQPMTPREEAVIQAAFDTGYTNALAAMMRAIARKIGAME